MVSQVNFEVLLFIPTRMTVIQKKTRKERNSQISVGKDMEKLEFL